MRDKMLLILSATLLSGCATRATVMQAEHEARHLEKHSQVLYYRACLSQTGYDKLSQYQCFILAEESNE